MYPVENCECLRAIKGLSYENKKTEYLYNRPQAIRDQLFFPSNDKMRL